MSARSTRLPLLGLSALALTLAACESDSTAPPPSLASGEIQINASLSTQFTYFSFASGQVVTVANPSTSSDWDLAFRRYEVRLNGGAAGPKGVAGFNLENNASATAQQVLAFTPDNQKAAFEAVGTASIPASSAFIQETLVANPLGWLSFGAQGPIANPNAVWKVRRASGGGYALFHTTGLTIAGSDPQSATLGTVTVEWRYQPANGSLGAKQQATIDLTAGNTTLNFATGAVAPPSGCDWDIQADGTEFALATNAACDVGTAPLDATQTFDGATTASDALQYGAFLAGLTGAIPYSASLDDPKGPFLYNLAGDNRLSPTFNTYLIKVGAAVYKIQLINYYSSTGASGYPTMRYAQIQ